MNSEAGLRIKSFLPILFSFFIMSKNKTNLREELQRAEKAMPKTQISFTKLRQGLLLL